MANVEISNSSVRPEGTGEPEVTKRWFFIAISHSGVTVRGSSETPGAFLDVLEKASIAWVDYTCQDFDRDVPVVAGQLGVSAQLAATFVGGSRVFYQDFDVEMGLKIPAIQVRALKVEIYPLLFLMKKNFILTVHPLNVDRRFMRVRRYAETFVKKIPLDAVAEDKLTLLLMRLIGENNGRNFEHLREIEERGDQLNATMTDPNISRTELGPQIYEMKHTLIVYLDALWDTVHVLHNLHYGDAELITNDEKLLDRIGVMAEDVNRQIGLAEHMSEVLASGLEVLQSIYNNQLQSLNNRLALIMTYLTIAGTAVLVPNTLATMLGNAVFDIGPKDLGWYLALMIGSTVVATGLVYWWVRRRGWIPRKMD